MFEKLSRIMGQVLVWSLILLLIAGLVIWGIADIITGTSDKVVAKVGNSRIYQSEIDREISAATRNMRARNLPEEAINEFVNYYRDTIINQNINKRLLELKAEELGLEVDEKHIIKKDFVEKLNFTKQQLTGYIRNQGGHDTFMEKLLEDKKINFMESVFAAITPISDSSLKAIHSYEKQVTSAEQVFVKSANIKNVKDPSKEELAGFYEQRKTDFVAPEYRSITYILLDKSIVKDDEADIAEVLYEASGEMLDKLASGLSYAEVAKELGTEEISIESINVNGRTENGKVVEIPSVDGFIQAVFSTEDGEESDILENVDGDQYAIIKVNSVSERRLRNLEEVKDEVVSAWIKTKQLEKALEVAEAARTEIDDGKMIGDVIKKYNLSSKIVANVKRKQSDIPAELSSELFSINTGKTTNLANLPSGDLTFFVAGKISKPNEVDPFELLETKDRVEKDIFQETLFQYIESLKDEYKVSLK